MVPLSFGCGSAVFAAIATLAPSRAARSAIASPIPRLAPDMNSVLPLSDVIGRPPVGGAVNPTPIPEAGNSALGDLECPTARPPPRRGFAGRERRAILSASRRSNWRKSAPSARPHDDLWRGAQPKYHRKSLVRSALRPAAIGGAAAAPPPRRRHPCCNRAH